MNSNWINKFIACSLIVGSLFNPGVLTVAQAQEVNQVTIEPINEDFISGTVTVSASITDSESPITSVTFRMIDWWEENEMPCDGEQNSEDQNTWACQIDTTQLPDSNDEMYDLQVDYEDEDGNSNSAYYSDNNNYFDIDNSAPQDPFVGSSSHNIDEPSAINIIDIFLESPDDSGSGVNGFSYSFTQGAEDLPDDEKDIEEDISQISSDQLENGQWYFHLRTGDYAGNWTSTVHLGPFIIQAEAEDLPQESPAPSPSPTPSPSPSPVLSGNTSSESADSSSSTNITPPSCNDKKPGSAPTLLSAAASENSVNLTWSKAKDPVSYYLIAYGTSPDSLQFGNPNVGGKDTTSFNIRGLSGGTTYYFRVRAGNGCMPGDYSNELPATLTGRLLPNPAPGFEAGILGTQTEKDEQSGNVQPADEDSSQNDNLSDPNPGFLQKILNMLSSGLSFITGLFGR